MNRSQAEQPTDSSDRLEELLDEGAALDREQLDQILLARKQLETLLELPGWDLLVSWGRKQRDLRRESLLEPLDSMDQVLEREYMKGEVAGIQLFFSFPEAVIDDLDRVAKAADIQGDE